MNAEKRYAGIDGLRAFAVLSVVLFHIHRPLLPGGFVGVDVFFVISGYVVCRSLIKDSGKRFLPFIGGFYVRRLLRIYPALIATGVSPQLAAVSNLASVMPATMLAASPSTAACAEISREFSSEGNRFIATFATAIGPGSI